jgi:hypothetical protein
MITIQLNEQEAQALLALLRSVVERGCNLDTAEASLVLTRRTLDAIRAANPPPDNVSAIQRPNK